MSPSVPNTFPLSEVELRLLERLWGLEEDGRHANSALDIFVLGEAGGVTPPEIELGLAKLLASGWVDKVGTRGGALIYRSGKTRKEVGAHLLEHVVQTFFDGDFCGSLLSTFELTDSRD